MKFCTAINCIDGRTQLPVIHFLQKHFKVKYVDMVTEPGPNKILAKKHDTAKVKSILARVRLSVENHKSVGLAIVGHHNCAGNPAVKAQQIVQIKEAVKFLKHQSHGLDVVGLWVDKNWNVRKV